MSPTMFPALPSSEYQILVRQSFRCKGVTDYSCPMFMRTFDRSGYRIVKIGCDMTALCPACHAVYLQTKPMRSEIDPRIQAKQRIIHFLHSMRWTVGNGEYTLAFRDFWEEFYRWSETERLYTKKSLVRSVITGMCGVAHDAAYLSIGPA